MNEPECSDSQLADALKTIDELRTQLADAMDRIDELCEQIWDLKADIRYLEETT